MRLATLSLQTKIKYKKQKVFVYGVSKSNEDSRFKSVSVSINRNGVERIRSYILIYPCICITDEVHRWKNGERNT